MTRLYVNAVSFTSAMGDSIPEVAASLTSKKKHYTFDHKWQHTIKTPLFLLRDSHLSGVNEKSRGKSNSLACEHVHKIIENYGLKQKYDPEKLGLYLSTTTGGLESWMTRVFEMQPYNDSVKDWFLEDDDPGSLESYLKKQLCFLGPTATYTTACSGGSLALAKAFEAISAGCIDACIVGAVDLLSEMTLFGFNALQVISDEHCRPFSADRKGINLGEAAAFILVEKHRTPSTLACVDGFGFATDWHHMTQPQPSGSAMALAMSRCLTSAGWQASDVTHLQAHATGTIANDAAESAAIQSIFADQVSLLHTKDIHGHCLAVSGLLELITVIARMLNNQNTCKRIICNSFGFGGNNVSLAITNPQFLNDNLVHATQPPAKLINTQHLQKYFVASEMCKGTGQKDFKPIHQDLHQLWRRLGLTSKALLLCADKFEQKYQISIERLTQENKCRFYHATFFGEMESGLRIAQALATKEKIISPTAFQQSVANTPIAIFSQKYKIDAPSLTIASGSQSLSKCLQHAYHDLAERKCEIAFICMTSEHHVSHVPGDFEAQIIAVSNRPISPNLSDLFAVPLEAFQTIMATKDGTKDLFIKPIVFSEKHKFRQDNAALKLLPHTAPMNFIRDVWTSQEGAEVICLFEVLGSNPYLEKDGTLKTYGLIEAIAQSAGIALQSKNNVATNQSKDIKPGYLVSVDNFDFVGLDPVKINDDVSITCHIVGTFAGMVKYNADAYVDGKIVAKATLKLLTPNPFDLGLFSENSFPLPQNNTKEGLIS